MSANTDLRWLKPSEFKGAARRFAKFCKTDVKHQAELDSDFDIESYVAASKLILSKLQASNELPNEDSAEC
ncbi:MAG: hypothetical protein CSB47_06675 [Proteobacteria bacterium]|nr:MAG: hypothetical protein CSB47_06675 [Pseudomonadota bacterium]